MRIISIKRGFAADHSSTSYEFLAVDKALSKNQKAEIASLSRRAIPTSRRVSFSYQVEGYDIPGGWELLMEKYYDVMYSESYDWWTLALAFNTDPDQIEKLQQYEFEDADSLGVRVRNKEKRVVVEINCRIDPVYLHDQSADYEDEEGNGEQAGDDETRFAAEDPLLDLLIQVRQQLINGDYRALYAVWETYGYEDEDEEYNIPVPPQKAIGASIVKQFKNLLALSE